MLRGREGTRGRRKAPQAACRKACRGNDDWVPFRCRIASPPAVPELTPETPKSGSVKQSTTDPHERPEEAVNTPKSGCRLWKPANVETGFLCIRISSPAPNIRTPRPRPGRPAFGLWRRGARPQQRGAGRRCSAGAAAFLEPRGHVGLELLFHGCGARFRAVPAADDGGSRRGVLGRARTDRSISHRAGHSSGTGDSPTVRLEGRGTLGRSTTKNALFSA